MLVKRLIFIILCVLAALLGLGPARALADGTVSAHGVTATLTSDLAAGNDTVTISEPGDPSIATYSQTVFCGVPCGGTLEVARTTPGPRPDVVLSFYEEGGPGGATELYDFSWSVPYATWVASSGGYPYPELAPSLEPLGAGYSGLVSDTPLFPYDSRGPIRIQRAIAGRLVGVTRRYPALITADAARWLAAYASAPATDNAAQLAAWAADEIMLGRGAQADAYLESQDGNLFYASEPLSAAQIESILAENGFG